MTRVGGTDSSIDDLAIAGFARMKALSPAAMHPLPATEGDDNSNRERGSRSQPFDIARNGFVISEGAGILVLEELETVKASGRETRILCEVVGYGLSGDASHITAPVADGDGARRSMQMALTDAGVFPSDIGYINAHATSTPMGDLTHFHFLVCNSIIVDTGFIKLSHRRRPCGSWQ